MLRVECSSMDHATCLLVDVVSYAPVASTFGHAARGREGYTCRAKWLSDA